MAFAKLHWKSNLKEAKVTLRRVELLLKQEKDGTPQQRRAKSLQSILQNLIEAYEQKGPPEESWPELKQLTNTALNQEVEAVLGKTMSRRSFLGKIAMVAGGAAIGASPWLEKFLAKEPDGFYIQVGAYSTEENARRGIEELEKLYPTMKDQIKSVRTKMEIGPIKLFYNTHLPSLDETLSTAKLFKAAYPGVDIGVVQKIENETIWLSNIANKVVKEQQELSKSFVKQHFAGFSPGQRRYFPLIEAACQRYNTPQDEHVDPLLPLAMMRIESNFKPHAISKVGAKGLLQLMPRMWRYFHSRSTTYRHEEPDALTTIDHHRCDIFNEEQNIDAAVLMLTYLHNKYPPGTKEREAIIVMAYHSGETIVNRGRVGPQGRAYRRNVLEEKASVTASINRSNNSEGL